MQAIENENNQLWKTTAVVLNDLIDLLPKTPEADLLIAFNKL